MARDGGEEEADDQHDDRGGDTGQHKFRHVDVERGHGKEGDAKQSEDGAEAHVTLGAAERFHFGRAGAHLMESFGKAREQVLAHAEKRIGGADHHAADGDGAHDVAPDGGGEIQPSGIGGVGVSRQVITQLRAEKVDEQRDEKAPGDDAAGEIQRSEFGTDDVSDAEKCRAHGGRGDRRNAARGQHLRGSRAAERSLLRSNWPTLKKKSLSGAKRLNAPSRNVAAPKAML